MAFCRWRPGRVGRRPGRVRLTLAGAIVPLALALAGCGGGSGTGNHHGSTSTAGGTTRQGARAKTGSSGSGTAGSHAPNGVAAKPPGEIVSESVRAIDQVNSVQVSGSLVAGGIPVRLDLHLLRGRGGEGQVSESGLAFRLIAIGRVLYIQGSDAFWSHFGGPTAAQVFHGKWLKAPNGGQFASIGALTSIPHLFDQLLTKHGALSKGRRATVNGQPAIGITDRTEGGTLYVATTGQPYPLQLVKRGNNGGYVTFNDFDQPVTLTAPAKPIAFPGVG